MTTLGQGTYALRCGFDGRIIDVLHHDSADIRRQAPGAYLTALVDSGSLTKATSFLEEVRRRGSALYWELNVRISDGLTALLFSGQSSDEGLLVVATQRRGELFDICDLVAEAMPAAVERMLSFAEQHRTQLGARVRRDMEMLDELTQLNNDLATMQRELAKRNADLVRLEKLKNQFLGMAAHDLRSPLSIVRTFSEFILEDQSAGISERHRQLLGTIHSSAEFMIELVNDLLDVSAIEAGGLAIRTSPTDLPDLVARNIAMQQVLAEPKDVHIQLEKGENLPPVELDARRFEQVLNNLIGNAVKFSRPGGKIRVVVGRQAEQAVLQVIDEGVGIPAIELPSLFEPFRRSPRGTAGEPSTGLGLAIARRIVTEHDGTIRAESQDGMGSTFTVELPIAGPGGDNTDAVVQDPVRMASA